MRQERSVDLEKILRQLRLMQAQSGSGFYALVALVALALIRRPVATVLISALGAWFGSKQGG